MTNWIARQLDYGQVQHGWRGISLLASKEACLIAPVLLLLLFAYLADQELFELIVSTLSEAYIAVSVFVGMTLLVFYSLDRWLKADLTALLNRASPLQVPIAAIMGALPGCGGAIIVVTQYVNGSMSFGALVAVLIATMGDAAFLLMASEPKTALVVYGLSIAAGIIFGAFVNFIHDRDFLKTDKTKSKSPPVKKLPRIPQVKIKLFMSLLLPGCVIGILEACQVDTNQFFGTLASAEPIKWFGFAGSLLCISIWMSQPLDSWSARFTEQADIKYLRETVVAETSFISVWVIAGFLCYELLVYATGLDLHAGFEALGTGIILLAILIGFVPGCGPQIVVTTLYLNGIVPLSAQLANAISNDGDALFPAIALAPKAAFIATLYSAIPAFILGYIAYFSGW